MEDIKRCYLSYFILLKSKRDLQTADLRCINQILENHAIAINIKYANSKKRCGSEYEVFQNYLLEGTVFAPPIEPQALPTTGPLEFFAAVVVA